MTADEEVAILTERTIRAVSNAVDDLTSLAPSAMVQNVIKECRQELIDTQRKINDLLLEHV